jgi:flagellar biosynthetic protein FlhB
MAERDEKIFPALPQWRQRAREEGRIARSPDLTGAVSFAFAVLTLGALVPLIKRFMVSLFSHLGQGERLGLARAAQNAFGPPLALAIAITLALSVAAVVGAALQGGIVVAPSRIAVDFGHLNPAQYVKRLFSVNVVMEIAKSAAKVAIVVALAFGAARRAFVLVARQTQVAAGLAALRSAAFWMLGWSAVAALAIAAADYAYKLYDCEMELRMTRQEFMDELKQEEGNPQVKRAIRKARRAVFKRARGVHQAAAASVVLTNPSHLAVAVRYRRGFDQAPLVVAKGAGEGARRIVAIARLAAVPVMENKPLARALFRSVDVGEQIPAKFYRAVAEVLALVMRAQLDPSRGERGAMGPSSRDAAAGGADPEQRPHTEAV